MISRLFSLFCVLYSFFAACVIATEVCFFDTGQGNCIAVKYKDKLAFIDCGATSHGSSTNPIYVRAFQDRTNPRYQKLSHLIDDVNECHFFVTHDHFDHKGLIPVMEQLITQIERRVVHPLPRKIDGSEAIAKFARDVCGLFDGDVQLVPIRPDVWQDMRAQNGEHDYNVMFKLKAFGRNVLFMGDISPQLFLKMKLDSRYSRELSDVDFLVASHHGTNKSGELNLIDSIKPDAVIFCSNPSERDHLPWDDIWDMKFSIPHQKVLTHTAASATIIRQTTSPIFTTSRSFGFYSLDMGEDGVLALYDGPRRVQLLQNTLSSEVLKKRISSEIQQFEDLAFSACKKNPVALSLITPFRGAFLARFPETDEKLFCNLFYLKYLPESALYKNILSATISQLSKRLPDVSTARTIGLHVDLLLEAIRSDEEFSRTMDFVSSHVLDVLMNNIEFCDSMIGILDNVSKNPHFETIWVGFFEKLRSLTTENQVELDKYVLLLVNVYDWVSVNLPDATPTMVDIVREIIEIPSDTINPIILQSMKERLAKYDQKVCIE